jgi:hypothetical protein
MAQKGFPAAFDEAKPQLGLRPLDFERLESFYTNGTLMVDELVRRRAAPHLARFAKVPHHMEALDRYGLHTCCIDGHRDASAQRGASTRDKQIRVTRCADARRGIMQLDGTCMVDYSFEPSAEPLNLAPQGRGLGIGVAPLVRISFKRAVRWCVLRSLHATAVSGTVGCAI